MNSFLHRYPSRFFAPPRGYIRGFIVFSFIVLSRNILETTVFSKEFFFSYEVILHHFHWYLSAALLYLLSLRHIAGAELSVLPRFSIAGFILFIPLLHGVFSGYLLQLEYIRGGSVLYVTKQMASLMYNHPTNRFFFYEILFLLVGYSASAWLFSRSILRTFLTVLFGYYGTMLIAGLQWFGVGKTSFAYIAVNTTLSTHQMLASIYFIMAVFVMIGIIFPEVRSHVKEHTPVSKQHWKSYIAGGAAATLLMYRIGHETIFNGAVSFALAVTLCGLLIARNTPLRHVATYFLVLNIAVIIGILL